MTEETRQQAVSDLAWLLQENWIENRSQAQRDRLLHAYNIIAKDEEKLAWEENLPYTQKKTLTDSEFEAEVRQALYGFEGGLDEAAEIVETHDAYGIDGLWADYPELKTKNDVNELFNKALALIDEAGEELEFCSNYCE